MKYYMSLDKDGCAYMTLRKKLFPLSLPSLNSDDMWIPGEWAPEVEGRLGFPEYQFWMNGYTVLTAEQVLTHLDDRLFEVEIAGEIINHKGEYHVCRKCRLIREVTAWNAETARLFALACARHVENLSAFGFPDAPPYARMCNDMLEKFIRGDITRCTLEKAREDANRIANPDAYRYSDDNRPFCENNEMPDKLQHKAAIYASAEDPFWGARLAASYARRTAQSVWEMGWFTQGKGQELSWGKQERQWQTRTLWKMLKEEV